MLKNGLHDLDLAGQIDNPVETMPKIIDSCTVCSAEYAKCKAACISERPAVETVTDEKLATPSLSFSDSVLMESIESDGSKPFSTIRNGEAGMNQAGGNIPLAVRPRQAMVRA